MHKTDEARKCLMEGLRAKNVSYQRVVDDARAYAPFINQILISCKVQMEMARMDEGLIFRWTSGIEKDEITTVYRSEALMYDSVMAVACEALGRAGLATERSTEGDFVGASRHYAAAVGIFAFLGNIQLPNWIAKGSANNVDEELLPLECSQGVASAFTQLLAANGQQMAIATVLVKPGIPNYSLLAKLCLGVHDQLTQFLDIMRKNAFPLMGRFDPDVYTLVSMQISLQKALSLYFQGRAQWEKNNYGVAIALLSEASEWLRTNPLASSNIDNSKNKAKGNKKVAATKKGVPKIENGRFRTIQEDLVDFRKHIKMLLQSWEFDNSRVYFENVPKSIPAEITIKEGIVMNKSESFNLPEDVEPLLLSLP